ncbi:hypothetical protein ASPZODRAFT_133054 [Penicilliopsis zonata CBS 506.65]|uniref:Endosomal/vacuolar adapter protein YPT35 n=1 Tax=Penicilliopsis zonata CBS 506.65 TaxID=1073090 RepID=A0A1L9SFY4_9EURO|nr:hypothetical protein ASPZODRAFT_133054 [Penicilliopsis zonata CBS 506.65]OJJ46076.1 hypothetical protein ASPZODRAFT_133054 [Penicilliopsis zonata CBS 506.65]
MEPANEEAGSAPLPPVLSPPPPVPVINADTLVAATGNHGDVLPSLVDESKERSKEDPVAGSVVPPYWRHYRDTSRTSQISLEGPHTITLEDHTEDPNCHVSRGLWAKSVTIDDYCVVEGKTGVGSYVVWNCKIQTLDGGPIFVRMRYSEFDDLRQCLQRSFPFATNALPALPPKSVLFKFRPSFLESRRAGLEYFLHCVLLNPEFSGSPIVKDFLFGRMC